MIADLAHRHFRASAEFEVVEHAELPPAEREALNGLTKQAGYYGVLVPRQLQRGRRAIGEDTAALLRSLRKATPLAKCVDLDAMTHRRVAALVLDGLLEVEGPSGFVSGASAHRVVIANASPRADKADAIASKSLRAIEHGGRGCWRNAEELSRWLYTYGFLPRSPHRARALDAIASNLDANDDLPHDILTRIDDRYRRVDHRGWWSWQSRLNVRDEEASAQTTLKLYVSPQPEMMPVVLEEVVDVLAAHSAIGFKLGQGAAGLLRPDKFMIYFDERTAFDACAADLSRRLRGVPAHGVPFSAAITADGLLSWGVDPPASDHIDGFRGVRSWRVWLTDHLARSLMSAVLRDDPASPAWQVALDRLALDGVQPHCYLPADELWCGWGDA